jgi:hypothetical protein
MPYASANSGAVDRAGHQAAAVPVAWSDGENERGDMTGVRATSPLVVIALGSRP